MFLIDTLPDLGVSTRKKKRGKHEVDPHWQPWEDRVVSVIILLQ